MASDYYNTLKQLREISICIDSPIDHEDLYIDPSGTLYFCLCEQLAMHALILTRIDVRV